LEEGVGVLEVRGEGGFGGVEMLEFVAGGLVVVEGVGDVFLGSVRVGGGEEVLLVERGGGVEELVGVGGLRGVLGLLGLLGERDFGGLGLLTERGYEGVFEVELGGEGWLLDLGGLGV
jgi:hypothetical protein